MNRLPHVAFDLESRHKKAVKIERLLQLAPTGSPRRLLEIGCGAGGISHYFGTHAELEFDVSAVDVHDNRQVHEGYDYQSVEAVQLPFEDATFDVVISNHVIEHVGDEDAQLEHLREFRRVLKPDGVGYLAVPNRWMITEPHYRLKFLSWWPAKLRTPYLRLSGKADFYDCEPLTSGQLERMLRAANLQSRNLGTEAIHQTLGIEGTGAPALKLVGALPDGILDLLKPIIPTLIYKVSR